jgi:hypothetical protein
MTLANCKHCGELFVKNRTRFCSSCQPVYDRLYMQVRDFLRVNPRSTVMDVHEKTGIPVSKILEIGKEEYIPFAR